VWRNFEEVFDLASDHGKVLAATNGGLLQFDGKKWAALPSPSGIRSIDQTSPLIVSLSSGRRLQLDGNSWTPCAEVARVRTIATGIEFAPGDGWLVQQLALQTEFPIPPPAYAYAAIKHGSMLLVGTNDGLYQISNSISDRANNTDNPSTLTGIYRQESRSWKREILPSTIPVSRPNGIAEINGTYVIGGLDGLFVGRPGAWNRVCDDAIRQIRRAGSDIWVVHGNGALDKLDPIHDQLYPDVMTGGSNRPWTCTVGLSGDRVLFGGMGGWSERSEPLIESFPPELAKDVVTAIAGRGPTRWIGTEQSGVVRFSPTGIKRWNPGNGLTDTWVTSFCHSPAGLVVGTLHSGLFLIVGDSISQIPSPTQRVTQLGFWKDSLVVGGMDGAWIRRGAMWSLLKTNGEETTSITQIDGHLAVTTASGVYRF